MYPISGKLHCFEKKRLKKDADDKARDGAGHIAEWIDDFLSVRVLVR
jgi:hypothetical protein